MTPVSFLSVVNIGSVQPGSPATSTLKSTICPFTCISFLCSLRAVSWSRKSRRHLVNGEEKCTINITGIPGGAKAFELVAKFCYGMKLELTASNVVLRTWLDSLKALQTCEDLARVADELNITSRCIESLAVKASIDPNLFGWLMTERGGLMQSPGGSLLWNGISTGARPKNLCSDWWYKDATVLSFFLYKRLISCKQSRGMKPDIIAGSLSFYAKRYLPGWNRRQSTEESSARTGHFSQGPLPSQED
ncbi:hypothetical protein MLD38_019234 [Melastoma candidum]|uniref:Uncharacterized protein n=1 Tax=Melastoma candidum TaxID=119954 RepID=A0ACB9QWA4_9MYRT|nr:hypothetical protein MLD38_019234 [Melastoma candidum]